MMKDTDWRPTPCPDCGVMRHAREYQFCQNDQCHYFGLTGNGTEPPHYFGLTGNGTQPPNKERTMKTKPKYLWENAS